MTINFKKLSDKAVQPVRTTNSGAGFNLTAASVTTEVNERGQVLIVYKTGLAVEIPEGYEGIIRPLDTICSKSIRMCGAPYSISGKLDDEIIVKFVTTTDVIPAVYRNDEQIAQLVINKKEDVEFVEFVDTTENTSAASGSQSPSEEKGMPTNSETATEQAAGDEDAPEQA